MNFEVNLRSMFMLRVDHPFYNQLNHLAPTALPLFESLPLGFFAVVLSV